MALLDIFKTNVVPIISINDIALKIPKKILKMSPICSSKLTIFLSAIGCTNAESNLYDMVNTESLIIGIIQIPIIIITPTSPTAFFRTTPHPRTVSTTSPKIFPTTGIAELTITFPCFCCYSIYTA